MLFDSPNSERVYDIAVDSTSIYAVGSDYTGRSSQWRIEKRNLSDSQLDTGFNRSGVVNSDPEDAYSDSATSVAIDSFYVYVGGYVGFNPQAPVSDTPWRIQKFNINNGLPDTNFGTNGVWILNPGTGVDVVTDIETDGSYIYVIGTDTSPTTGSQWRIEKRLASTAAGE